MTFDVPAEVSVGSLISFGPRCDRDSRPIRCEAGDVQPHFQQSLQIQLVLRAPPITTQVSVKASASSDTPDRDPSNDSVTRTFDVVESTSLYLSTLPSSTRVDPGSVVVTRTELHNLIHSNPHDIRVRFELSGGTIAAIKETSSWSCTFTESSAECRSDALDLHCDCAEPLELSLRTSPDRRGGVAQLIASASSSLPEFNPGTPNHGRATIESYRWLTVTNGSDEGTGSLRQAILDSDDCGDLPCKIAFEISSPLPSSGWFTLTPSYPYAPINASRVFVDATTQTMFSGDTNPHGPEVAIDGRFTTSGRGVEIHSACSMAIRGLAIGNFPDHGLVVDNSARCTSPSVNDLHSISLNYLGLSPHGDEAWPNLRGLYATGVSIEVTDNVISGNRRSGIWMQSRLFRASKNKIGVTADGTAPLPNGASGIFIAPSVEYGELLRNEISFNEEMGAAVSQQARYIDIRENSMKQNGGLGIDVGMDGANPLLADDRDRPSNPPIVLSATYDAATNVTVVRYTLTTSPLGPYGNSRQLDVYVNDSADGDGERWIGAFTPPIPDPFGLPLRIAGDYRGKWLNMTSTRVHFIAKDAQSLGGGDAKTSELSNAVLVQ